MTERNSAKYITRAAIGIGITAIVSSSPEAHADLGRVYGEHCRVTEYTPKDNHTTDFYYFPGFNGFGELLKAETRKMGENTKSHTLVGFGEIFTWTRSSEYVTKHRLDHAYALPGGLKSYLQKAKSIPGTIADCKFTRINKDKFFPPLPNPQRIRITDA